MVINDQVQGTSPLPPPSAAVESTIFRRFEEQAERYPRHIAVKTQEATLTYDQLNRDANRVAHTLLSRSGSPGASVALLLEPGVAPLLGILGVLKAGGRFIPLDPDFPEPRNRFILQDSGAQMLLFDQRTERCARRYAGGGLEAIDLDRIDGAAPDVNPRIGEAPESIPYIIYTSGSTGSPKGVYHTHRNVLHFIANYTRGLKISPSDRLSQLASCSVSASMMDIFAALLTGAALLPYDLRRKGIAGLAEWLINERVTVYHSVPTVFDELVNSLSGEETFPDLRIIDFGGEPSYRSHLDRFKRHFADHCVLVNGFGTTELNVIRQFHAAKKTQIEGDRIPAGYPIPDTEVMLLDETGRQVETGRVGEIVVASRYAAMGYWNRPELTRAVFKEVSGTLHGRLYHTGDLGRMAPDGCLVHLGRKDHQVQVRGYRVELLEIEIALKTHPAVSEAAVAAEKTTAGDTRLAAFVARDRSRGPSAAQLRDLLRRSLPGYMVPAVFVFLDALPRTPSGKIDRGALTGLDPDREQRAGKTSSPRTPVEKFLAETWSEVLETDRVGIHDDFFELGGHSLLAVGLIAKIRSALNIDLSLREIFLHPTVAALAERIVLRQLDMLQEQESDRLLSDSTSTPAF